MRARRWAAVQLARARREPAAAELELIQSGEGKPNLAIAEAELALARARVELARTDLERLTVRAPIDGSVLKVDVRPGEYAAVGPQAKTLMLLGATEVLHARVDIDENDAWRFRSGSEAVAFLRGNRALSAPLAEVRIEPYVLPKKSLTGDSTERVDTRVLQVVYRFDHKALPAYVGHQLDVFIEAPPLAASAPQAPR